MWDWADRLQAAKIARKVEQGAPAILNRDDFVLLTDGIRCWIVRIEDISLLEACQNLTLVHFPGGKLFIRRCLADCERRLHSSIFFRASKELIKDGIPNEAMIEYEKEHQE